MTTSPRLGFTYLLEGQALPATAVNEIAAMLESGAGHFIIKDRDLAAPPGSPANGDSYIVAASPSGAWASHAGAIAVFLNTAWVFVTVIDGMTAVILDEGGLFVRLSGTWSLLAAPSGSYVPATVTMIASETISAGQFVSIHASSGAKIRKANATDDTKPVNGFAAAGIASAAAGAMTVPGNVITGLSGLTPGAIYYLDTTAGAITDTPPSGSGNLVQEVGVALSATSLLFNPKKGLTL
jgi:hypothetical protein